MDNTKAQMAQELSEAPLAILRQEQALAQPLAELVARLQRRPPQVVVTCARGSSAHAAAFGKHLIERYAGIPVQRRIGLLYLLSGCVASLAAIVYVAHLGQAKSDAGSGYELDAITAVVLGGTSVFGGRGTLGGWRREGLPWEQL